MVDSEEMGKNVGDDLVEGKFIFLLFYVMWYVMNDGDKVFI